MHAVLASDPEDPDFAPEEPSEEHVALISATIDEQIERIFIDAAGARVARADQRPLARSCATGCRSSPTRASAGG